VLSKNIPQPPTDACIAVTADCGVAHFAAQADPPQPTSQWFAQVPATQSSPAPHDQVKGIPLQLASHWHMVVPRPVHVTLEAVKHWDAVPDRHVLPEPPLEPEAAPDPPAAEPSPTLLSCPKAPPVLSVLHPATTANANSAGTTSAPPDGTTATITPHIKPGASEW
jgi:hypothetical protein